MVQHTGNKFFTLTEGLESYMEYEVYDPSTVVFTHTWVPEELRGKGLAKEIIKEGLDWAMENKFEIIPACSAVRIYIDRHPEYQACLLK
ncbi:MAG: N-acetyltransferase [Bacteroidales bacterium]|nr:N-acetyltransferase [Bacteroidales bacterium]MCF8403572.1 N-acetyltransferase [Bacteroidales bacterium]